MIKKHPLCPSRIRIIPKQFSWVDHRLVREGYIDRCSHYALVLYLFLVTVGDAQGISYYSDSSIIRRLSMDASILEQAREDLIQAGLIAYKAPLYQVLSLDSLEGHPRRPSNGQPMSMKQILKQIAEGK